MRKKRGSPRGRTPSIATVTLKVRDLKRSLKSLVTEVQRLESRLGKLDSYYRHHRAAMNSRKGASRGMRGRGPNVRDVSYEILKKRGPLNIQELARRVAETKGGRAGANFVQNLGAALFRDRRFKRAGRGLYATRR